MAQQRGLEPPIPILEHLLSKQADYHYHTAANFPGAAIFTLFHQPRPHRKPEIREHVTDVLWRRGWESNPQGRKDLPVFETGWHSRLRSSPYGGKGGTRTPKTELPFARLAIGCLTKLGVPFRIKRNRFEIGLRRNRTCRLF